MARTATRHLLPLLAAAVLALSGCAGFEPQPGPGPEPSPAAGYRALTTPIIAVGDTQEHESTGYPLHDNDSALDAYIEVTQRPPEQALFGRRLLEWALASHPDEPFIHLGDVMDLSCRSEALRIGRIFQASQSPGAILPGNHDGLMFGIFAHNLFAPGSVAAHRWNQVCRRGADADRNEFRTENEALTKRGFIATYLSDQIKAPHPKPGLVAPAAQGPHIVEWRNPNPDAFLSAARGELIDGPLHADSFLVQRLVLPRAPGATRRTIVIALDTNQSGLLAGIWDTLMGRSPGSMGHIHPDQITAIEPWIDESIAAGDIVVFAGHHNWRSLGLMSRTMMRQLVSRLEQPLVYLSAHTHRGFWAVHRTLAPQPLLELNVSSLSDWPIAYRRISFAYDEEARRLLVRGDLLPRGGKPNASDADLLAAWRQQACEQAQVPLKRLDDEDDKLVRAQKSTRGSLMEWLLAAISPLCESCEKPLYRHAQAYLDEILEIVLELDADLGRDAHRLHTVKLPTWCGERDFSACTRAVMAEQADSFAAHVKLFRRKAALAALFNEHLDDLTSHRARAYMTCRAALAAKDDFDATPDERNADRGERKRQAEQFFRIEASVGMH
ncbi:hypothetical protein [Accumulibacter sp.]|uniref:hypothetical protein n=1 Tax=Accumulibacter sp. TaxID=2053492 RepID=UPI0025DB2495|nr:hypothetical protein [Accumulibacter sp.]MCM8613358.1 hypothetical protein [Accumulibacter sp.]MCM8637005.1 hypothetical protein [Accumulibacter sp.]MCM8641873.1 hypothetical protein [Accumulibacter sp.]